MKHYDVVYGQYFKCGSLQCSLQGRGGWNRAVRTGDGTQEAQRRRLLVVLVEHSLLRGSRQRDGQCDWFVELPATRLDRHDGRDSHAVAKHGRHCVWRHRLSLETNYGKNAVMFQKRLLGSTVRICVPGGRL